MGDLQKTQNEQIKITIPQCILGSDNRLNIKKESISKLENIAVETIQKEPQRKERLKK